jgi:hypothetical protein
MAVTKEIVMAMATKYAASPPSQDFVNARLGSHDCNGGGDGGDGGDGGPRG